MRFKDRNAEMMQSVENLCLILSLGAIFIQIWVLISAVDSYLAAKWHFLGAAMVLSGICLACCVLTAWTTTLNVTGNAGKNKSRGGYENSHGR